MPRRAGKKRTAKRALIAKIKEAQKKDEETRRAAPRIIEEQILLDLPPLLRVKPSEEKRGKRKEEKEEKERDSGDSLHLFPEELDRDLDWSPDEFDREYFRLWEEENNQRWEEKREKGTKKMEELFGEDSDMEKEKRKIEEDRRARMERERKAEEIRLFGEISDSEEEEKGMEIDKEKERIEEERMEIEREEEKMEVENEVERMEVESEEDDIIIIEEERRIDRIERDIEEKIRRRDKEEREQRAGASRAIVPKKVQSHWLKARSRLDLSLPLLLRKTL